MIVIKTMTDLPEHCYDCPCHDGESGYCQADKEHRYSDYRPFWCPLVKDDVRDDAISRQAAIDACLNGWNKDYKEIVKEIRALPSVNPAEKAGQWIEERTYMKCPNCYDIWHYEENQTERFRHCPSCGEKMEVEVKE